VGIGVDVGVGVGVGIGVGVGFTTVTGSEVVAPFQVYVIVTVPIALAVTKELLTLPNGSELRVTSAMVGSLDEALVVESQLTGWRGAVLQLTFSVCIDPAPRVNGFGKTLILGDGVGLMKVPIVRLIREAGVRGELVDLTDGELGSVIVGSVIFGSVIDGSAIDGRVLVGITILDDGADAAVRAQAMPTCDDGHVGVVERIERRIARESLTACSVGRGP
jgi:hypothetical protein